MSNQPEWQIHSTVAFQWVENGFFVITSDNALHQLQDPVSVMLWEKLDEGVSKLDELVSCICSEFSVNEEDARRDIQEFLDVGVERELIAQKGSGS